MEDQEIIALYWRREEGAIQATAEKYGRYCRAIAKNILGAEEDAEECVNDTYLSAWNTMPPQRPQRLPAFLGKLTRNLAFNRYKRDRAQKRGGGELPLVLDELDECLSDGQGVEEALDRKELTAAIDRFLRALPEEKRVLFIRRYWYAQPVKEIALSLGMLPVSAAKALERIRAQLRTYLLERGFVL